MIKKSFFFVKLMLHHHNQSSAKKSFFFYENKNWISYFLCYIVKLYTFISIKIITYFQQKLDYGKLLIWYFQSFFFYPVLKMQSCVICCYYNNDSHFEINRFINAIMVLALDQLIIVPVEVVKKIVFHVKEKVAAENFNWSGNIIYIIIAELNYCSYWGISF